MISQALLPLGLPGGSCASCCFSDLFMWECTRVHSSNPSGSPLHTCHRESPPVLWLQMMCLNDDPPVFSSGFQFCLCSGFIYLDASLTSPLGCQTCTSDLIWPNRILLLLFSPPPPLPPICSFLRFPYFKKWHRCSSRDCANA